MPNHRPTPLLLPLLLLAACGEEQPSTAPTSPADPGGPAYSHVAGHRVVNSVADPGNGVCNASQCTLREAINDPGSTEISFAAGLTGPITLARPTAGGGTLGIDKNLTITGPSAKIVIRRRTTDPDFRIFRIGSATVAFRNLVIQNGKADRGGGIINRGTLRLFNSTVSDNSTTDPGGGIMNFATLHLVNTAVARNSASSGGGIANQNNATLTLSNSTITSNSGGGILNNGGTFLLGSSTVSNNSGTGIVAIRGTTALHLARIAGNQGGGIFASNARVTLTNSTVARNSATVGGGINNRFSRFTIANSTISGNSASGLGGGISNEADNFCRLDATVRLNNSTVSGNSAPSGGGIVNQGCGNAGVIVLHGTIVRNSASQGGGGILETSDEGGIALENSLIAQNRAPTGPDVSDEDDHVSASFSLIGNGGGNSIGNTGGNQVGSASSPIDPKVGPLNNNGGPTRTHALLAGSPALDAASAADCTTTDQRGVERPQGTGCDIGSYERVR